MSKQLLQCIYKLVDDSLNGSTVCVGHTADPRSFFSCINIQIYKQEAVVDSWET